MTSRDHQGTGYDGDGAMRQAYETPELEVLGTVAQLTQENFTGSNGDSLFLGFGGMS